MPLSRYLSGPLTGFGFAVAAVTCVLDQASKLYLLFVYDLAARGQVPVVPTIDFVLVRNAGISYGLFQQETAFGAFVLLAIKVAAVVLLWAWLARAPSRLMAVALGLIIGGAIGNAIDRLAYGWVVDFVLFHLDFGQSHFNWYVFNLADAAIVAGVGGLLYDSFLGVGAAKRP